MNDELNDLVIANAKILTLVDELAQERGANAALEAKLKGATAQLTRAQENNHKRNLELDALHYVWCDGGCKSGVHRFSGKEPLSTETVKTAIHCVNRMVDWYTNYHFKPAYTVTAESVELREAMSSVRFLFLLQRAAGSIARLALTVEDREILDDIRVIVAAIERERSIVV